MRPALHALAAAALVAIPAFAGCLQEDTSGQGFRTMGQGGPAGSAEGGTIFLLANERYTVNGSGERRYGDHFGPWCPPVDYAVDPPSLTLAPRRQGDVTPPGATFVRRYGENDDVWEHHEISRTDFPANGTVEVRSPFDPARVLFTLRIEDGRVYAGERLVEPGSTHELTFEYAVGSGAARSDVTEVLVLRHLGTVEATVERMPPCD